MVRKDSGDASGVRIFPPAVYLAALVLGYIVQWFWPVPIIPGDAGWIARVVGALLTAAGLVTMVSALRIFRRVGTPANPTQPTTALAFDGPYRFTRNPMYLAMSLMLVGLAGVGNALWPLIAVIPAIAIIQTQVIAREERYLAVRFGDEYRAYAARVRRWL